jgi:phage-related protein
VSLKLGELVAYLKTDNSGLKEGLAAGKAEVKAAGADMGRTAETAGKTMGEKLGDGGAVGGERFTRDAAGRLRDAAGRFVREGERIGHGIGDGLGNGVRGSTGWLSSLRSAVQSMGGAFSSATGWIQSTYKSISDLASSVASVISSMWAIAQVLLMVAAAATFAAPAIGLLGGALGSLPALAAGGGAALGVLGLGFMGLSDQFRKTASAGGSVVDKAWQIAQAERRVRDANLEVLASQVALTRAREDAAKRMDALNRSLAGAHLDERAAVIAVADAQKELATAQLSGDPDQIARAQLAYDQAVQSLDDIRARLKDMTAEQKRNAQQGVAGSDEVKAALDRQRKATEGLADAQHALQEAQKPAPGGGGGAAAAIMKIAPAAKAAMDAIKSLKPAFDDLRLDVQQRLFSGVGGEIKALATAWLPQLHTSLGGMADTFNGIFKVFTSTAKKPEFIANIAAGIESVRGLIDRVGKALAGPFLDAWGRLSKAAAPFIKELGNGLGTMVEDFSKWIKKADESGQLKSFFEKASGFLNDVSHIGKDVFKIIGDILAIAFGSDEKTPGGSPLEQLKTMLDDLVKWFDKPENKQKIKDWFDELKLAAGVVLTVIGWVAWLIDAWAGAQKAIGDWVVKTGKSIKNGWDDVTKWLGGLPGRIGKATSGLWDGIKNAFKSAVNWIINRWNGLSFRIPPVSVPGLGQVWGGMTLDTPNIPQLKDGGIVRATPGGRLVNVGEGGQDEAVVPLSRLGGGHSELRITGELVARGSDLVLVLRDRVAINGGNVQAVIGSST